MSRTNYQIKNDGKVYYRGTLAQLLDVRDIVVGEPTQDTIPPTINPLKFLCNNLLCNNGFIVKIKKEAMQNDNGYIHLLSDLQYVIPPEKGALICIDMPVINDAFTYSSKSIDRIYTCIATKATNDTLIHTFKEHITVSYNRDECDIQ